MAAKILIVGAGPSGLTAALELARQGIVADLIDAKTEPSTLSRAVDIIPATMDILEASGVAADLRSESVAIERAVFHSNGKEIINLDLEAMDDPEQRLYGLPQDRTETILRDHLLRHGGCIEYGQQLKNLELLDDGVKVIINGTEKHYDYVIGADGLHSQVRESAGIDYPGYTLDDDWSIADVYIDSSDFASNFNIYLEDGGKVVLLIPLESKRLRIISNTSDALKTLPVDIQVQEIKRSGQFKISVRQAESYSRGRVYLVGDAAHCHSPVGGRGMNLGIADAVDLAHRFVHGDLEGYHAHRHAIGQKVIETTERARKMMLSGNTCLRDFSLAVIQVASSYKPFNKLFLERVLLVGNTV